MGEVIQFRRPLQPPRREGETEDEFRERLDRIARSIGRINELMAQLKECGDE